MGMWILRNATNLCYKWLFIFSGIDIGTEAVTDGYNLFEFREVRSGTVRCRMRTAGQPRQTGRSHMYRYVEQSSWLKIEIVVDEFQLIYILQVD